MAVPSAIKVFNWLATMYKGSIYLGPPMVWTLMFIVLFSIGGLTGLMQGALGPNIHIHDTSFIVAHFHYTMFGGAGVIFFAAMHYWWPKMFGRMYNMKWAYVAAGAVLRRLQPDVFPAVPGRTEGHAPAVRGLPAGVHGLSPALHHRLVDPGRRAC